MWRDHPRPAALRLLLLTAAAALLSGVAAEDRQVSTDTEVFAALLDQTVTGIGLQQDYLSLEPHTEDINRLVAADGAFVIERDVRIYDATGGRRATIDFAYLASKIRIQTGHTFTFDHVKLRRAQVWAPIGIFAVSPGATVIVQNCVNVQQVCWPHEAARKYFLNFFTRPVPGSQVATICAVGDYTCTQYTFTDVAIYVNPNLIADVGGYNLRYLNTLIDCKSFPSPLPVCPGLAVELPPVPICLATVFNPASLRTICPKCRCINGCRDQCNSAGIPESANCD